MKPPADLDSLFFPTFVRSGRAILRATGPGTLRGLPEAGTFAGPLQAEITHNHIHFDWAEGRNPRERWRNNLALAKAARLAWKSVLDSAFAGVTFRLLIMSQARGMDIADGTGFSSADPTLYLFQAALDVGGIFEECISPNPGAIELVYSGESFGQWVRADDFFTKSGQIRKRPPFR
ncbi:MAG: hypothetical protein SF028_10715 [Candidatus Sumerlaeia bacterium]|nr:hypothetical protein [Candidatus Sumerlaeia bacterium]